MFKNIDLKIRIILFSIIAISISNIFRFDLLDIRPILLNAPAFIYIFIHALLEGSGVFIAAILCL